LKGDGDKHLLELKGLTKYFGGLGAVQDIDLGLKQGEIMGLIGPNGAGKTTVFNLVSGVLKPTRGSVIFQGEDITGLRSNQVAHRGLVRTFQANTLFPDFTVMDNVLLGCHLHVGIGFIEDLFNISSTRHKRAQIHEKAMEAIAFVGLNDHRLETAKNLAHGHQRALGIGIAIVAEPKLLLLDEPVSGMNIEEKKAMTELINSIRERGITVFLVEHDMRTVMGLCDRIAVLNFGKKIAQGTPEEIQKNEEVVESYLGAYE
jgi:branched-chain amino acid transport system ATP-binding protein